jgi:hypothetical protein
MFNVYSIENQNFYLNDSLISGIKNFNIGIDLKIAPQISINDSINYTKNGLPVAEFDLSYTLSDTDRFLQYTGINSFYGAVEYGDKYVTFTDGYLTNYSLNYKLGEYPTVDIKGIIFNWPASQISFTPNPVNLNTFNIGDPCFIDTNIGIFSSNRVQSFGINIGVNRIPNYTIGNYSPDTVYIQYPIRQELSFDTSASDTVFVSNLRNLPNSGYISPDAGQYISIKKYQSNSNLATFDLPNNILTNLNSTFSTNNEAGYSQTKVIYLQP